MLLLVTLLLLLIFSGVMTIVTHADLINTCDITKEEENNTLLTKIVRKLNM